MTARMKATPNRGCSVAYRSSTSRCRTSNVVRWRAVAVARYTCGATIDDQPSGSPGRQMVCSSVAAALSPAADVPIDRSTAPDTSSQNLVAGSRSANICSPASYRTNRAHIANCIRSCRADRSKKDEPAKTCSARLLTGPSRPSFPAGVGRAADRGRARSGWLRRPQPGSRS